MKASEQTNDGASTPAAGAVGAVQVEAIASKSALGCIYFDHVLRTPIVKDTFSSSYAARGRPIIVEWERDAGISRSVTHRYVTERYTFQSDSQPQPNLRRCHVKNIIRYATAPRPTQNNHGGVFRNRTKGERKVKIVRVSVITYSRRDVSAQLMSSFKVTTRLGSNRHRDRIRDYIRTDGKTLVAGPPVKPGGVSRAALYYFTAFQCYGAGGRGRGRFRNS
ncbi:hypothetical protein EVAR_53587_1 [Eumeta japonica]|uniref:Uncharacterized protein n=1 Tax=Eumeta variegata TaxID=151549 RepID=A0A4C1YHA7_EUMVA|nr:hypothetical protein EVAR_53587_1 [Eumeta japonica]